MRIGLLRNAARSLGLALHHILSGSEQQKDSLPSSEDSCVTCEFNQSVLKSLRRF